MFFRSLSINAGYTLALNPAPWRPPDANAFRFKGELCDA
jgi:hypothetical protein